MSEWERDGSVRLGLGLRRGKLWWVWREGHLRWAPRWVRELIISIWNPIACRLFGHTPITICDDDDEGNVVAAWVECQDCNKKLGEIPK